MSDSKDATAAPSDSNINDDKQITFTAKLRKHGTLGRRMIEVPAKERHKMAAGDYVEITIKTLKTA